MSFLNSLKQTFLDTLKTTAIFTGTLTVGATSYYLFDHNIGGFRKVEGPSMRPTFNDHLFNYSHYDKLEHKISPVFDGRHTIIFSRSTQGLARGDVVIVKSPRSGNPIIKRVVGLGGDIVKGLGVNNIARGTPTPVPTGHIWLESDAGFGYEDSSIFGPVNQDLVQAKVTFTSINWMKFWQFKRVESKLGKSALDRLTVSEGHI